MEIMCAHTFSSFLQSEQKRTDLPPTPYLILSILCGHRNVVLAVVRCGRDDAADANDRNPTPPDGSPSACLSVPEND